MKHLAIVLISFLISSCEKEICYFAGPYVFVFPISLTPNRDTFSIGDTISIFSSFNDDVYERKTNHKYKLVDWKFDVSMIMREISGLKTNEGAFSNFTIVMDSLSSNFTTIQYNDGLIEYTGDYTYLNNNYSFNYKIIPNKPGIYFMSHSTNLIFSSYEQDFEGICSSKKGYFDSDFKMNDGNENNIHMLSSSPIEHFKTWMLNSPDDRFHRFGGYCFYVKE